MPTTVRWRRSPSATGSTRPPGLRRAPRPRRFPFFPRVRDEPGRPAPPGWGPPARRSRRWGNVMYIPAAPWCPRNERYAADVRAAFRTGASPSDFPADDYERDWPDRFKIEDLN